MKLNDTDRVVVFGSGTIAARCVKLLRSAVSGDIYVYEKKQSESSVLEKRLSAIPAVRYRGIGPETQDEVLRLCPKVIFSVNNTHLFPGELASRFPILNYHNALLPKHPGRNAEAWTIFSQDNEAGVTWHFVDQGVDTGNIILQEEIPLNVDTTSIQLLSTQTKVAYAMFQKILEILRTGEPLPRREQRRLEGVKLHYSWERPHGGELDLSWDIPKAYAFLRAMDYGKLALLGAPTLVYDGARYTWSRYSIEASEQDRGISMDLPRGECAISGDGHVIKLSGLRAWGGKDG